MHIGFIYVGPIGDHGWTYAHDLGRRAVERAFGSTVKTTWVENVPEGPAGDLMFQKMTSLAPELVIGTVFGYKDSIFKAARAHPGIKFEWATGYQTAVNIGAFDVRMDEAAYLAGMLAGATTKSNVLGSVGAIPIPEVIRSINSFALGAQVTNPRVRVKVSWVGSYFHPDHERRAALALMSEGADVLMQTTDSTEVMSAAQSQGKRAIGWYSDMRNFAPRAHLASAVADFGPLYVQMVRDVADGRWQADDRWWGLKEHAVDLVSIAPDVPAAIVQRIDLARSKLRNGSLSVWQGPLVAQDGKVRVAAGHAAEKSHLRQMYFFVRGIEGTLPRLAN